MADASKLNEHLDKVAYGVAGLLAVVILALPFVFASGLGQSSADADAARLALRGKIEAQQAPSVRRPRTTEKLQTQWEAGRLHARNPHWSHQIAPVLIRKISTSSRDPAKHLPPQLIELSSIRDAAERRSGALVKGTLAAGNEHVVIKAVEIWRKEGEDGVFSKIHTISEPEEYEIEYADYTVRPGEHYSYQLISLAERDPEAPAHISPPTRVRQTSGEMGPAGPVPFDLSIRVYTIFPDLSVSCKVRYWDYESGEAKGSKRPARIKEKEFFADGNYYFFPVNLAAQKVTVRNANRQRIGVIDIKAKERPIEAFETVEGGGEAEAEAGEESPDAEGAASEAKEEEKKESGAAKRRRRREF